QDAGHVESLAAGPRRHSENPVHPAGRERVHLIGEVQRRVEGHREDHRGPGQRLSPLNVIDATNHRCARTKPRMSGIVAITLAAINISKYVRRVPWNVVSPTCSV